MLMFAFPFIFSFTLTLVLVLVLLTLLGFTWGTDRVQRLNMIFLQTHFRPPDERNPVQRAEPKCRSLRLLP
jgi:hypothetical protein